MVRFICQDTDPCTVDVNLTRLDITCQWIEKAGAGAGTNLSHRHTESSGHTFGTRIATEAILSLGNADWHLAKTCLLVLLDLPVG